MFHVLLIVVLTAIACGSVLPEQNSRIQSYRVKGQLLCGDQPAKGVRVKLIDDDFGSDPDDELEAAYTDENGRFTLDGGTKERTTIDPHLKIYHDCNDGSKPCQRRWKFELPHHYITDGDNPQRTLDMGIWNLEAILPGESHDCIH
ncbi:hypothetical protein AB6A40_000749 [Gnathostoma spinigerum]|uniref:Uncharacterized protein n=1 Tax=Gnathostoma spinigerum TaxID=75299 RepID=A0ABD6ECK6_9BILA